MRLECASAFIVGWAIVIIAIGFWSTRKPPLGRDHCGSLRRDRVLHTVVRAAWCRAMGNHCSRAHDRRLRRRVVAVQSRRGASRDGHGVRQNPWRSRPTYRGSGAFVLQVSGPSGLGLGPMMIPAFTPSGNISVPTSVPTLPVIKPADSNAFMNFWSASSNANDNIPGGGNMAGYGILALSREQTISNLT